MRQKKSSMLLTMLISLMLLVPLMLYAEQQMVPLSLCEQELQKLSDSCEQKLTQQSNDFEQQLKTAVQKAVSDAVKPLLIDIAGYKSQLKEIGKQRWTGWIVAVVVLISGGIAFALK